MTSEPFASNPTGESATEPLQALLRRGEEAACTGRLEEARRHFEAVLQAAPEHVEALLWLAWLAGGGRPSLAYLVRVLEVDPANRKAREAIRWARKRAAAAPNAEPPAPAERPGRGPGKTASHALPAEPWRAARRWRYALGGLAALALLLLAGLATVAFDGRPKVTATPVAWLVPSAAASATSASRSTATLPPTWTPVPSPTPTAPLLPVAAARRAEIAQQVRQEIAAAATAHLPPHSTPRTEQVSPEGGEPGNAPSSVTSTPTPWPTTAIGDSFRWIDVDLTHQRLTAYEGETPVHEVVVSTGLPRTPTVTGRFRIYVKYSLARMRGPGYDLPNVPWVMYFYGSYGIHGTYWHTNFGQPASHGCINLPKDAAEWLYNWAEVGTLVNIHY